MIAGLVHADGGGVTVNHPTWTMLGREFLLKLLDHDPRVLGCEVLEAGVLSENYWDWALATGPRVHVFARVKAFATDGSGEILFSQPFMLDFPGLKR